MSILCIYHKDCADGFASAWAVHELLGPDVEFIAAKYGQEPPREIANRDVLIVDFSYPLSVLRAMASEARSVLVLDHHKTAQEDLRELDSPVVYGRTFSFVEWLKNPGYVGNEPENLAAIFDMDRSGAGLTWDYLSSSQARPHIINLVEDYDLWRFNHDPDTRQFYAVAASHGYEATPESFARWDYWYNCAEVRSVRNEFAASLDVGAAILRAERRLCASIIAATRRTMHIAGYVIPVACCPGALASEVGNLLCSTAIPTGLLTETIPWFSATYYDGADERRHFSLRSPEGGADVGEIARRMSKYFNEYYETWSFTGGGHVHAAGFDAPIGWEGE